MSRISAMTIGLVLILTGVQLIVVKSYYLSPKTARFIAEHFQESSNDDGQSNSGIFGSNQLFRGAPGQSWPYYQTDSARNGAPARFASSIAAPLSSFGPQRVSPPRWLSWPILFLGVVFFLHGVALRGD